VVDVIESDGRAAITYEVEAPAGTVEICHSVRRIRDVMACCVSGANRAPPRELTEPPEVKQWMIV
jgi:hypothetical protein